MYMYINFEYVLVNDGYEPCSDARPSGGCGDPCAAPSMASGGGSPPVPAAASCGSMERRNGLQECCL